MTRVVIDTNCLRASIPPRSPFYQLYLDFRAMKFEWWVSTEILLDSDFKIFKTLKFPSLVVVDLKTFLEILKS